LAAEGKPEEAHATVSPPTAKVTLPSPPSLEEVGTTGAKLPAPPLEAVARPGGRVTEAQMVQPQAVEEGKVEPEAKPVRAKAIPEVAPAKPEAVPVAVQKISTVSKVLLVLSLVFALIGIIPLVIVGFAAPWSGAVPGIFLSAAVVSVIVAVLTRYIWKGQ